MVELIQQRTYIERKHGGVFVPITNCKRCGRIYNKTRRDICPACIQEEESMFETVRSYLRHHRDATMAEVSEATEVDVDIIIDMIRDGRLILRDNPNLSYACERCGHPTQAGRYCARCTKELSNSLSNASSALKQKAEAQKNNKGSGYHTR